MWNNLVENTELNPDITKMIGPNPWLVSDSNIALETGKKLGYRTSFLDGREIKGISTPRPGDGVVLASFREETTPPSSTLREMLSGCRVLLLPAVSFTDDERGMKYEIEMLNSIPFQRCIENIKLILEGFENASRCLRIFDREDILNVNLVRDIPFMEPRCELVISKDDWASVAQYIELGLIPKASNSEEKITLDGELLFSGFSVAHHIPWYIESRPICEKAWSFLSTLRSNGETPLRGIFSGSKCEAMLTKSGINILNDILEFTDSRTGSEVLEIAISTLPTPLDCDWSRNSQINEAAGGVHVALGMGMNGAHIDFVNDQAKIDFI